MLKRSAIWPIMRPPTEEPNQASELASEGAERAPPRSAAIGLSPTAVIHRAPNDSDSSTTQMLATTQEDRVSMLVVTKALSRQADRAGQCSPPFGCSRPS